MGTTRAPHGPARLAVGNAAFTLEVEAETAAAPAVVRLTLAGEASDDWAPPRTLPAGPVVVVGETELAPGRGLDFQAMAVEGGVLRIRYATRDGLEVVQQVRPSPRHPVWRSQLLLVNRTGRPIEGIRRFDALNAGFGVSEREPEAGYVLGWLEGPRVDAPGRHSIPYRYGGWIPRFLYGEDAVLAPPPSGGWNANVLRPIHERLTKLPLRSGKRSTYENHPWVTVLDSGRQGGFFVGFEWSGTWRIDVEHHPVERAVSVSVASDGCVHRLEPGGSLESPPAFAGLFGGDWDDASNVCRRFVRDEILPPLPEAWPPALHVYYFHSGPQEERALRAEIDRAAEAGFETSYLEARWWAANPVGESEFSLGLGDFSDSRVRFPMGVRGLSDYVHEKGMRFGLWVEFERVDIRQAGLGPAPFRPEWVVHRGGHPYRSWCQHVYLLCLGVPAAAEWALENVSRAVREYDVDWLMMDSNEWGVCDDPSHGHGAGDGEWAQIQGLYRVLGGLRERFPHLTILNSAGGGQRGDFGVARYCSIMHPHDSHIPSSKQRRYLNGLGCMYPAAYVNYGLYDYRQARDDSGWIPSPPPVPGTAVSLERMEWRGLNRILGGFCINYELRRMPDAQLALLRRLTDLCRAIRPALRGDRYVLAGPQEIREPENEEGPRWEGCELLSPDGSLVVVALYRCLSPSATFPVRLRGLDPDATYRVELWSGAAGFRRTGVSLMTEGWTVALPRMRTAEIALLRRTP